MRIISEIPAVSRWVDCYGDGIYTAVWLPLGLWWGRRAWTTVVLRLWWGRRALGEPQGSWLELPVHCHWALTNGQPQSLTILICVLRRWYRSASVPHVLAATRISHPNSIRSSILESVPQQLCWITQGHPHALAGCKTYWWTRLGAASEAAVDNHQLRSSLGPQHSFLTLFLSLGRLRKRRKREQGAGNKAALSPLWGESIRTKAMLHNWQGVLWLAAMGPALTNVARWRCFNGHNL